MEKWKRKIRNAMMGAALLAQGPSLLLGSGCEPCNPCDWSPCDFGGVDLCADFLYWKPCLDDLDFATTLTDLSGVTDDTSYTQHIHYKSICPDWQYGFRLGAAITDILCDWRLSGSYTRVDFSESSFVNAKNGQIVVSPFQFAALTNPQGSGSAQGGFHKVKGDLDVEFQSWDVLLSRAIGGNDCYTIAPFIGAEGLILNQEIKTKSLLLKPSGDPPSSGVGIGDGHASTKWESDFTAYGAKFGTDYNYRLSGCLQFFTRGSFTIALGDNDGKNAQSLTLNTVGESAQAVQRIEAKEEDSCIFINGYHIQLGFIYETDLCGWDLAVRLGYELLKWHNVPKPRRFPSGDNEVEDAYNRSISTSPSKSTLGLHGLMAGVSLSF